MTMKMEKICMPLPIIHIMKHMNPTCLNGAVAVCHRAWGRGDGGVGWGGGRGGWGEGGGGMEGWEQ